MGKLSGKRGPDPGHGGAPVKFTDEVIELIAEELVHYASEHTSLILEGFCVEYKKKHGTLLWPQRLSEFAKRNEKLSEALQFAKSALGVNIFTAGSTDGMPPALAKLGMVNVPGWHEKKEIEHKGEINSKVVTYHKPERHTEDE